MNISKRYYPFFLFLIILFFGCSSEVIIENRFSPPEWSKNLNIYEVNIRQYTEEGTFKAFEEHLPKLKEMGVGILWLMPIHPIGEVNRKGSLGSYYSVKDYKDVNPEFGTLEDFRSLVDKAHSLGMYLIIDWVANHTSWDNSWTETNPDFYEKNENGEFLPPHGTDWTDVIQLDFNSRELWKEMTSALKFWVDEYNIDGYRCDVAAMVPIEFWIEARESIEKKKKIFFLAEAHESEMHKAFDMTYNWQLKNVINSIAKGERGISDLDSLIEWDLSEYPADAYRMSFTTNHDENSWNGTAYERLGDMADLFSVLASTIRGMHLIYNGQEAGLNKPLQFFEKDEIEWNDHHMRDVYRRLNSLKKTNPALWNGSSGGSFRKILSYSDIKVYSFIREKNQNEVAVLLNFDSEDAYFRPDETMEGKEYSRLFNDGTVSFNSGDSLKLGPFSYEVLYK